MTTNNRTMKDEKNSSVVPPLPSNSGTKPAGENPSPVAATPQPVPTAQPVPAANPPASSPALFGGHKGGGKKRADGLVAGSPEAIAADKEKNRIRMAEKRLKEKTAAQPPPLPGVALPGDRPAVPLVADDVPVSGSAASPVAAAAGSAFPTFVAWTLGPILRIVKLATRIVDRLRVSHLMGKIRKLKLKPEQEKQLEEKIQFKADALADFNNALANCAVVELNKRRVGGSEYSHFVEVVITGGELINNHMSLVDDIEKMLIENGIEAAAATPRQN
jgi:hypothetical protein